MSNAATSDIKVTHRDIPITYDQDKNLWRFELRGRQRSTESLAAAKKAIDAPPPKDKKPFLKIKAYHKERYSGDGYVIVDVTCAAEKAAWQEECDFWISSKGKREKVSRENLFECSTINENRINQINELSEQAASLAKRIEKLHASLKTIKPVEVEESEDE